MRTSARRLRLLPGAGRPEDVGTRGTVVPECRVPPSAGAGTGGQEGWVVQVWDRQDEGVPGFGDAHAMWVPSEKQR